ncbi:MAG TPA: nuclease [Candidatus Fraserbacteria bacterium]|nr:nuclease [Candidatus Fraserbacteria bacterium]
MKVLTHLVAAEVVWFATTAIFEVDYPVAAIGVAAGAALLPDIDYPASWVGFLFKAFSDRIASRAGHRGFFHSFLGFLAFGLLLYPLYLSQYQILWWAAMAGYWSHILVDMMSLGGVKLFWPSPVRAIFPGRDDYRVRSGSSSERVYFFVVLALALLLYPLSQRGVSSLLSGVKASDPQWVQVARVVDGDTIVIDLWGSETKVRLIGVDTPETVAPNRPIGCYGPEASAFTKRVLGGQVVRLSGSTFGQPRDIYGRLLAYVALDLDGDGQLDDFNLELLRRGLGRTMSFAHDRRREYLRAERAAKAAGVGLWGKCR